MTTPTRAVPRRMLVTGVLLAFLLAGFASGYASSSPDGLEKVAADHGFGDSSRDHAFSGFFLADYAVRGIEDPRVAGGVAGVIGVAATLVVGWLLFLAVSRVGRRQPAS